MSGAVLLLLAFALFAVAVALMVMFNKAPEPSSSAGTAAPVPPRPAPARVAVDASPDPTGERALESFARTLERLERRRLPDGAMRVEGLLCGEHVSLTERPESPAFRSELGIEAVVPTSLTETLVRGPAGPKGASDRAPHALLDEPGPALALRTLLERVDEVELRSSGIEARSRESLGERSMITIADTLITLAGFVRIDASPTDPTARLLAARTRAPTSVGKRVCPFCRDGIDANASDTVACEGCATLHHADCWTENAGRCTVLACGGDRVTRVGERA